jgi:hypothetical protein
VQSTRYFAVRVFHYGSQITQETNHPSVRITPCVLELQRTAIHVNSQTLALGSSFNFGHFPGIDVDA